MTKRSDRPMIGRYLDEITSRLKVSARQYRHPDDKLNYHHPKGNYNQLSEIKWLINKIPKSDRVKEFEKYSFSNGMGTTTADLCAHHPKTLRIMRDSLDPKQFAKVMTTSQESGYFMPMRTAAANLDTLKIVADALNSRLFLHNLHKRDKKYTVSPMDVVEQKPECKRCVQDIMYARGLDEDPERLWAKTGLRQRSVADIGKSRGIR